MAKTAKKAAPKKSAKSSAKPAKDITIRFNVMGQEPTKKTISHGSNGLEVKQTFNLSGLTVTVNGLPLTDDYIFQPNDRLVAVAQVKGA